MNLRSRVLCHARRGVSVRTASCCMMASVCYAVIVAARATGASWPLIRLSGQTGNARSAATAMALTTAFTVSSRPVTPRNTARRMTACISASHALRPSVWQLVTDISFHSVAYHLSCRALVLLRWPLPTADQRTGTMQPSVDLFLTLSWQLVTRKGTRVRQSG